MTPSELERETKTNEVCDGCGACCAPGILGQRTAPYLEVTADDLKNDFKSKKKLVAKNQMYGEGAKLFLPVIRGSNDFTQCEHLKGTVLNGARCGCYDVRPTACRIFEPGDVMCQKLRQAWLVHQDKVRWELLSPSARVTEPSTRDYVVAASVIQWLGSAVGQHFWLSTWAMSCETVREVRRASR